MDLTSGCPYWPLRSGLGLTVPPLERDRAADVAIIGGGISGALLCDQLIDAGLDVIVLDRRHIGRGSTAASTALLQYEVDTPLHELRSLVGSEHADRVYTLGVDAVEQIATIAQRVGVAVQRTPSLYVCRDPQRTAELRAEFGARQSLGLDVAWLEREEMLAHHGVDAHVGILSAAGACVDPFGLCHALLASALQRGASVHDRTSVLRIESGSEGVLLRTDRGATVSARYAIHASGYEALKWLPQGIASLHSTFAFVSEPIEHGAPRAEKRCMVWEYATSYLYARWADNRLIVGGGDAGFKHSHARDRLLDRKIRELTTDARSLFPGIEIEPAFSWAGTFASTKDGLAYIGAPHPNGRVLYALGFGGNGITYSVLARRLICDTIMDRHNADAALFRFDR